MLFPLLFGYREVGIIIKNVDISFGEVTVNLNEGILMKKKSSSDSTSGSDRNIGANGDSMSTKEPSKKQQTLASYSSFFPEKVWNLSIIFFSNHHVYFLTSSAMVRLFPCE